MDSLVQKRGAEIVRSLTTEGYRVVNTNPDVWFYVLRHPNGNVIHVVIKDNEIVLFKNGVQRKKELVTLR